MVRQQNPGGKPIRWEISGHGLYKRKLVVPGKQPGGLLQFYLRDGSNEPNPKHGKYREIGDLVLTFVQQPSEVGQEPAVVAHVQQTEHVAFHGSPYYRSGSEPHIPSAIEAQTVLDRLGATYPDPTVEVTYSKVFDAGVAVLKGIMNSAMESGKSRKNT